MFETLFTPNPSVEAKVSLRPRKGVISMKELVFSIGFAKAITADLVAGNE